MAKRKNKNEDASTDPKLDTVVQTETTSGAENKDEAQEVHTESEQSTSETIGGGQTEGQEYSELDSANEVETDGKAGVEGGGEVDEKNVILTESDLPEHLHPEPKKIVHDENGVRFENSDEKRGRIAADVFAKNHRKSVLYFTSDMIPFFEKTDAIKHASGLDIKTVVTVNKE